MSFVKPNRERPVVDRRPAPSPFDLGHVGEERDYRIVKTEREESERARLLRMEHLQNEKAEMALESKQKQVYRKVLKTMIREEISYNLTKENKQRIEEREILQNEQRMKRYNSAQLRS